MRDRPFEIGFQEQVSNHLKLLSSKAMVVSVEEKADSIRQVRCKETSVSEPLKTCRKVQRWRQNRAGFVSPGEIWKTTCLLSRWRPA